MHRNSVEWDGEYDRRGIPSSVRDEPSGVLLWALGVWPLVVGGEGPSRVLDVGCGTGRNSMYLARRGARVLGFDSSRRAIEIAKQRAAVDASVEFALHDLERGLPGENGTYDLVTDIFVYKHQMSRSGRRRYRAELARVLSPTGVLLVSLAGDDDGYYSICPAAPNGDYGARAVVDPEVGIGSVLFTLESLWAEMGDRFRLEMSWQKLKDGEMHGGTYRRSTIATLWRHKSSE